MAAASGGCCASSRTELGRPTEAMRNSFRSLELEHRDLLIALLDAPAGLIDGRDLAATIRRHHAGGLRRPPAELIDRLADHFLRVTEARSRCARPAAPLRLAYAPHSSFSPAARC